LGKGLGRIWTWQGYGLGTRLVKNIRVWKLYKGENQFFRKDQFKKRQKKKLCFFKKGQKKLWTENLKVGG